MSTSKLSIFCKAIYLKPKPISSQPKFIASLFESAGANFAYRDEYGRSLGNGSKDLTQDIGYTFSDVINGAEVSAFLHKYLTHTTSKSLDLKQRCTDVAAKAGRPTNLSIQPEAFVSAHSDRFPRNSQDTGEQRYLGYRVLAQIRR